MNFEQALREQCEKTPDRQRRAKKILAVLDAKPSKRRTRRIERMERHAAAHIGRDAAEIGDWSEIPWAKVFDALLKLLLMLLPLLL